MAFGQVSGPPASAKDVARLAELLGRAGFDSFKEARHPYGLTQRQASGKFTRDEAEVLLVRLEAELDAAEGRAGLDELGAGRPRSPEPTAAPVATARSSGSAAAARAEKRRRDQQLVIAAATDAVLVAELELRGWTCIAPTP